MQLQLLLPFFLFFHCTQLLVPSSMTKDQNKQIFEIMRRKAKDERAAAVGKIELELELMRRGRGRHHR